MAFHDVVPAPCTVVMPWPSCANVSEAARLGLHCCISVCCGRKPHQGSAQNGGDEPCQPAMQLLRQQLCSLYGVSVSVVAEPMRPFVEGSLGSSCLTIPAASDYGNLRPSVIDLELTTEVELSAVLVGHVPAGHVMREGYMLQVSAVPGTSSFGACNGISGNPQSSSNGNDDESAHQHLPPLARVHAVACSQEGMLHAVQTLLQLLPPPVATPVVPSNNSHRPVPGPDASRAAVLLLPTCQVFDAPRFAWRGVLLDVGRHFFSVPFILDLLRWMGSYKLNKLHWHLTEDQGWRLQVLAYPRLTQVGAWRKGTQATAPGDTTRSDVHGPAGQGAHDPSTTAPGASPYQGTKDDARSTQGRPGCPAGPPPGMCGGYYTQEDVRQVVAVATALGIDVIPEIELPGHCGAALAAYPWLSCSQAEMAVPSTWGIKEDVYCAGRESTYTFLEGVLQEVLTLFPSRYIHIGGDEVPKTRWKECSYCQARLRSGGLGSGSEDALQAYFVARMARWLADRGRTVIGWDEVLEGGRGGSALPAPPQAVIMSWRGVTGGLAAVKAGLSTVLTPTSHCYLDYKQGKGAHEPGAWYAQLPLRTVYGYELLPSSEELRGAAQAVDAAAAGRSGHEWAWALNGSTCTQVFHGQHAGTGQPPALSPEGHECRPAVAVTQNGAGADAECSGSLMDSSSMYEQQAAGGDMLQADLEMEIRSSQRSMNTSAHLVGHDCPGTCSGVSMPKKGSALPSLVPGMNVDQAVASLFMSVLSPTAADASGTGAAVGACKRERSQGHDCASPVSALLAPHRCVRRSSGPAAVCLQPSLQGSASSPDTATDSEGTPCASAASCPWVLAADHSCSRHAGPIAALPHGLGAGGMRSCSSCVQLGGTPGTKDDVVQEEAAGQPESAAGASDVASGHAEVVKNGGTRLPIQLSCKDSPGLTPALADEPDASTSDGRSACASYELTVQERARILGSQANLWTEYVPDEATAQYMLLPRMPALAEALWSPPAQRSYNAFKGRLRARHLAAWSAGGWRYRDLDSDDGHGALEEEGV